MEPRTAHAETVGATSAVTRLAAIDVGTNAIRFLAAEADGPGAPRTLAEKRYALRLGHDVFTGGVIREVTTLGVVDALTEIAGLLAAHGVSRYRAVATSAVREARNRGSFLRMVRRSTGIALGTITGNEEARLVHAAVRERIALGDGSWMFVELGGGSAELFVADAQRVRWCQVHDIGAVRLKELFARSGSEPRHFAQLLKEYTAAIRFPAARQGIAGFVATGGNIESLLKLDGSRSTPEGIGVLGVEELARLTALLGGMSPEERAERLGLRSDRADVILPAAIVYARFAEMAGAREILVPGVGIREGIIRDLARMETQVAEVRGEQWAADDAAALGRRFSFDEAHGRKVMEIAGVLFDAMRSLHGMGEVEKRLLLAASLLHDVGYFVSDKGHHKHSSYLLSRAELPGFSRAQMHIVAGVARYHRRSHPSVAHPEFASLPTAARRKVRVLAALLRVADALDREHEGRATAVCVTARRDRVEVRTRGSGDLYLEQWALRRKAALFEEVFGVPIELTREEDQT